MKRPIAAALAAGIAVTALVPSIFAAPPTGSATPTSPAPAGSTQPATTVTPDASAAPDGTPPPASSAAPELPPGHPPAGDMPSGHPPTGQAMLPRPNAVIPANDLPPGAIAVKIVDAFEQPIANAPIELEIFHSSVTEGDKREVRQARVGEDGTYTFEGLPVGSGISYEVSTPRGEARFAAHPFGLNDQHGIRVLVHAYEPVTEIARSALVMEAFVVLDVKQDTIRVSQLLRTLNVGREAFVARGMRMELPEGARAFSQQESSTGVVVKHRGSAIEMSGTFPPGQLEIAFGYTIPLDGGSTQRLRFALPPRVANTTVMVGAGPQMKLDVAGFPPAERTRRRDGIRVLQTVKTADLTMGIQGLLANVSPSTLDITITGLPSPGYGAWLAVGLSLLALAGGLATLFAQTKRGAGAGEMRDELIEAREALLDELVALERAHRRGDVGPKSYERLREALLDALARIVARIEESGRRAAASR